MNDQKKKSTTKVVTKEQMIKLLAEELNLKTKSIKPIYNSLENKLRYLLSEANENQNVSVRLFEGISFNSQFIPKRQKLDNFTGKKTFYESKIKPKAVITRRYGEKLNQKY